MASKNTFFTTKFIGLTERDGWECFEYIVSINGQNVPYYAGIAHSMIAKQGDLKKLREEGKTWTTLQSSDIPFDLQKKANRSPVTPKIIAIHPTRLDVEYALYSDMQLGQETFEDFCANLGYNTDSRKALASYLECQDTITKMRGYEFDQKIIDREY